MNGLGYVGHDCGMSSLATRGLGLQSAICNFGGLRTVCNALGGLRDPE
eukprot:COSAG01_NODE_64419_length_276_cov_1.163842_1_plen_47_part_10